MAEIQKSRLSQFLDWERRLTEFEKVSERERNALLHDLRENLPQRLVQLQKYLRKWLKEGCYVDSIRDSYRCVARIVNIIDDEAFDRLNSVKEHLTTSLITECCMALNIIEYLEERSTDLNTLQSAKETSEEELMSILESLCKSSDVLEDIKTLRRQCQETGWPPIILKLNARMMTDVELLITRLEGTLKVVEGSTLVDRLEKEKAQWEQILEQNTTKKLIPDEGLSYIFPGKDDVQVDFPSGVIESEGNINIQLEPVRESTVQLTEVLEYSDTIYIDHDEEFLKPVQVKVPLTMLGETDVSACELFCVHVGDDDISINEDVEVHIVSGNVCSFETTSFSGNGIYGRKKVNKLRRNLREFFKEIRRLNGASPHNILLFLGNGYEPRTWTLHAEIVEQSDVTSTIRKRQKEKNIVELQRCRSPSLIVRRIKKIEIRLRPDGPLTLCETGRVFIEIIAGADANFVTFPVRRKTKDKMATIYFKTKSGKKLYTAHFDPRDMSKYQRYPRPDSPMTRGSGTIPATTSGTVASLHFDSRGEIYRTTITPTSVSSLGSSRSEAETSDFWEDRSMLALATKIPPNETWKLSIELKVPREKYEALQFRYQGNPDEIKFRILEYWNGNPVCSEEEKVSILCAALEEADLNRIAGIVMHVFRQNRAMRSADFRQ